jgi:hypothetical protein
LVSAVSEQFFQKRELAEQSSKSEDATITILDICGVNDDVKQQAYRIDKNVTFFPLDLFTCVVARRINAGPPFSALFTL